MEFERLARVEHDGHGVIPGDDFDAWVARPGRMERIAGTDGRVLETRPVPVVEFELLAIKGDTSWIRTPDGVFEVQGDRLMPGKPPAERPVELDGDLWLDGARFGNHVVGLDAEQVLVHIGEDGTVAEWQVHRPTDLHSIRFTGDGGALLLIGGDAAVFFAFDPDGMGFPLYDWDAEFGAGTGGSRGAFETYEPGTGQAEAVGGG